jgi:hypothetical protein
MDRFDAFMCIQVIDKNGNIVSEHQRRLRCAELTDFLEDIEPVYKKHHPGSLFSQWKPIKTIKR